MSYTKPVVLITMGDPAGIGPEVILKALKSEDIYWRMTPVVMADEGVLQHTRSHMNIDLAWTSIVDLSEIDPRNPGPYVLSLADKIPMDDFEWGFGKAHEGLIAAKYLTTAVDFIRDGLAQALVTAPIYKSALVEAGYIYPGQSELLQDITKTKHVSRMLVGDVLKLSMVTGHTPLKNVSDMLSVELVYTVIRNTHQALTMGFDVKDPLIAVTGLNPHGGDASLMGAEEEAIIQPAVSQARAEGMNVEGPLSTSDVYLRAVRGEYNAAVAMYHDQGVIPFKLLHLYVGVTVTLGLPFVRTAPVHGPAFDVAGQNRADARSMLGAIITAANLAQRDWMNW